MTTQLLPLADADFPTWMQRCISEYTADLVATGLSEAAAYQQAQSSLSASFPTGAPTPQNAVFTIRSEDQHEVGYLWVGRDHSNDPSAWWVWDIVIDPAFRGRGCGRAAMELAEQYARSQGAATLGLNVFGFNTAARGLYESLGYETTSVKMRKQLTKPAADPA